MKGLLTMTMVLLLAAEMLAQDRTFSVTALTGINTTKMNVSDPAFDGSKFTKGGYYFLAGLEAELRLTDASIKRFHVSALSGISYLKNGFSKTYTLSLTNTNTVDGYYYENINISMRYVQVPLVFRFKWRPFPLLEDFHLFAGMGVSGNILLESRLSEKGVVSGYPQTDVGFVIMAFDLESRFFPPYYYQPSSTESYSDEDDITDKRKKFTMFSRLEFGMTFERVTLSVRFSKALQDMYATGMENTWAVPAKNSLYRKSHQSNGKTLEKYSEVVIGVRIF